MLRLRPVLHSGVLLFGLVTSWTCSDHRASDDRPAPTPIRTSDPVDLTAIAERVQRSFIQQPDGVLVTGDATWSSKIDRQGRIEFAGRRDGTDPLVVDQLGLTIELIGMHRDAAHAPIAPQEVRVQSGVAQITRGNVTEYLRNEAGGLEQSWRFAARPEGSGDLVLELKMSGQRYVEATASGHHFVDPITGVGTRYGRATWIDARGHNTSAEVSCSQGRCELRVPAAAVDEAQYPAVLDPMLSPEFGTDAPVYIHQPLTSRPSMAFDGSNFLVVWTDYRNYQRNSDIFGARVTQAGVLLDPVGFPIASHTSSETRATVAFGDGVYLVAWNLLPESSLLASRISVAGEVLDPGGFLVATSASDKTINAAFGAGHFLIAWSDSNLVLRAVRVTSAATILDPVPLLVPGTGTAEGLAGGNTGHLLTWYADGAGILATRIDAAGNFFPFSGTSQVVDARGEHASVASDGAGLFFIVWSPRLAPSQISGALLGPSGLAGPPFVLSTGTGLSQVSAAFDGTSFVASWGRNAETYVGRVTPAGQVLDGAGILIGPGWAKPMASACAPGLCLVATGVSTAPWNSDDRGVLGMRVSLQPPSPVGDAFPIATMVNPQRSPGLAFNGTNHLVVWADFRPELSFYPRLFATRVSPAGVVLDDPPILLAQQVSGTPRVTSNGNDWLVAYTNGGAYAQRVSASGALLDVNPILLSNPAVSYNRGQLGVGSTGQDGGYLVAWGEFGVRAARVEANGTVLEPGGLRISSSIRYGLSVASDGTDYLVAFGISSSTSRGMVALRIGSDGGILGDGGISLFGERPKVVFEGAKYFVFDERIGASRLTAGGQLLDPNGFTICSLPRSSQRFPEAAFDGEFFLTVVQQEGTPGLIFCRWSEDGGVNDAFTLAGGLATSLNSAVMSTSGDQRTLLAYNEEIVNSAGAQTNRVKLRLLSTSPGPQGGWCSRAVDCASGYCVDGVCCDLACGGGLTTDCLACSLAAGASQDGVCGAARAGGVCRLATQPCDLSEACDGVSLLCPPDLLKDAGITCRGLNGACDALEACDGVSAACPPNQSADAGTPCDDTNSCTQNDSCSGFACAGTGLDAGAACDDGDPCRVGETCSVTGFCTPGERKVCPAEECQAALCTYPTGACQTFPLTGPTCDGGVCQQGICTIAAVDAGTTSDGGNGIDAGVLDAGTTFDAGAEVDAGTEVDAGAAVDAGTEIDAGSALDAGVLDAGAEPDAGATLDGGASDAGLADAGNDVGTAVDSGVNLDGGAVPSDAGIVPNAASGGGCQCGYGGGGNAAVLALLALALSTRRRVSGSNVARQAP